MIFENYPLELDGNILNLLESEGISRPFPVQQDAAKLIYGGHDLKIKAPTGSGKTLAYVLPLGKVLTENNENRLVVLTSSPELSSQIHSEFKKYYSDISTALIVGSANLRRQKEKLKTEPQAVFATPGRLFELFCLERISINEKTIVVMDEMDTLIEGASFEKVFAMVEGCGQLITTSATFNEESDSFLEELPQEIELIEVTKREGTVHHSYVFCSDDKKEFTLIKLLRSKSFQKVLIFVNDIRHINHLFNLLIKERIKVGKLDSKTSKNNREKAVRDLKASEINILISTDAMARGIDVQGLSVIQYSVAREKDIYIHRSGRVGRAGSEGWSVTLVSKKDSFVLFNYAKQLQIEIKEFDLKSGPSKTIKKKTKKEEIEGKVPVKKRRKKNRVNKNKGMRRKKL